MAIKYRWLEERLKLLIQKNIDAGIPRLPTEEKIANRYKVSRQTVRQALCLLEEQGLIEKRQGSGSYITGLSDSFVQNTIELLISSDSEYTYPAFIYELQSELTVLGFLLHTNITHNEFHHERLLLQKLILLPPRVLIVEPVNTNIPNPNIELYRTLMKKGCHIIFINESYDELSDCICIAPDYEEAMTLLTGYLLERGHKSIGVLLCGSSHIGMRRYNGFMSAMLSFDIMPFDKNIKWYFNFDKEFIKKAAQELSASCTAIICENDMIANEILDTNPTTEIFSFDHSYLCEIKRNAYLSMYFDYKKLAQFTASTVKNLLRGQKCKSVKINFDFDIP